MPNRPARVLALRGQGGDVELGSEAQHIGFLRDACSWVSSDDFASFKVPFTAAALEQVATCCRAAQKQLDEPRPDIDYISHFTQFVDGISITLLFEVLRAANFLDFPALLSITTKATARLLRDVRSCPDTLASVLCAESNDTGGETWSGASAAVDEPILERPNDALTLPSAEHAIRDEDALTLCLLECDASTLRALKGLSVAWSERARAILCEHTWQLSQRSLDLDWALGLQAGAALSHKRWSCVAHLCRVLSSLETLTLLHISIDVKMLRERVDVLDARAMRRVTRRVADVSLQRTSSTRAASKRSIDSISAAAGAQHGARGAMHLMLHRIDGLKALQLAAALWTLCQSTRLQGADLSTLVQSDTILPDALVRALAWAVRHGVPGLNWLQLHTFRIPVHRLRGMWVAGSEEELRPMMTETFDFKSKGVSRIDLIFMCGAFGDLAHVSELDLSRNPLGDEGLCTLVDEMITSMTSPSSRTWPVQPPRPLRNLRILTLNECDVGDAGATRLALAASEHGLFKTLEHLSFVGNRLGDHALGMLSAAFLDGAFSALLHLNLGSNDLMDEGCSLLAAAIQRGALQDLIHLSLARNQIADYGLDMLARSFYDRNCRLRLQYLGLGDNYIGNRSVTSLSHALHHGRGLSNLNGLWLADNDAISDHGIARLMDGLCWNSPMQHLYLHSTSMKEAGWRAVVRALPSLPLIRS